MIVKGEILAYLAMSSSALSNIVVALDNTKDKRLLALVDEAISANHRIGTAVQAKRG